MSTAITPFRLSIPEKSLTELRARLVHTRLPSEETVQDNSQGPKLAAMEALRKYWTERYDWRRCEALLNGLGQFKTEINGLPIHFLHVRSQEPHALPLLLTHGWPGSVLEVRISKRWAEARFKKLVHYKQAAAGGHFAALEQPQEFVEGVRATFRNLRS